MSGMSILQMIVVAILLPSSSLGLVGGLMCNDWRLAAVRTTSGFVLLCIAVAVAGLWPGMPVGR